MATKAQLKKITDTFSVTEADVQTKYDTFYARELELGRDEKAADIRALRMVELSFKKGSIGGPTDTVRMIVLGMKEPMDSANKNRDSAANMWKTNPTKAIKEGYTDQNGIALDMKKEFGAGNPNKNYGKPLQPNWMRILFGFNTVTKKEMTFILKGEQASNMEVPYFKVIELNGKDKDGTGVWNGTKSTHLTIVDEATLNKAEKEMLNIEVLVSKHLKHLVHEVEAIEEWCTIHGNKDVLITTADVIDIDMELNKGNSRTIILDNNTDYGQRVFCPEHVPIDFAEMSKIVVISSAKPGKEDYGPTMTAMGLYASPDFKYEPEKVESIDEMITYEEQEEEDEGVADINEEPEDEEEETTMKTATPMLIVKVISSDKTGHGMTKEEISMGAVKNGFDVSTVLSSIDELIKSGEITLDEDGRYTISKDEDTDETWV